MKKTAFIKISALTCVLLCSAVLFSCGKECQHENMTETVVEPTHEKQGRTVYRCNDCEYEYSSDYTAPLGHTTAQEVHEPTCTEQGYTYNYCQCGYHYTSDYTPPLGHTLSISTVAPTCDTEGYKIADCSVCGEHYTFDIASPLGHSLNVDRTFVSAREQHASSHYTCDVCELDYVGDHVFYHDIYKGAYVENTLTLAKGVDVSYYQHDCESGEYLPLDWVKIKEQGFDFAILRAGYMKSDNILFVDPVFEMNYRDAKAAGLDVGVYFYSYAYSVEDAKAEAEALLTLLDGKQFEYPIFFDIEYSDETIANKELTAFELTEICTEFISIIQQNGYYGALYTNNKWLTQYFETEKVTTLFDIWYARYTSSDIVITEGVWSTEKYGTQMAMWQFSETGTIEGLTYKHSTNKLLGTKDILFDLNYCYKDYPTLIKSAGLNGYTLEKDLSHLD